MTVDDLFPEDEGGDDHPIMALFIPNIETSLEEVMQRFQSLGITTNRED